jgi:hypothetical protein
LQSPEPDTIAWTEKDGLPTSHARFVGRNVDGVWVTIGDRGQPEIGLRAFNGSASPVHVVLTLLEPGQAKVRAVGQSERSRIEGTGGAAGRVSASTGPGRRSHPALQ